MQKHNTTLSTNWDSLPCFKFQIFWIYQILEINVDLPCFGNKHNEQPDKSMLGSFLIFILEIWCVLNKLGDWNSICFVCICMCLCGCVSVCVFVCMFVNKGIYFDTLHYILILVLQT